MREMGLSFFGSFRSPFFGRSVRATFFQSLESNFGSSLYACIAATTVDKFSSSSSLYCSIQIPLLPGAFLLWALFKHSLTSFKVRGASNDVLIGFWVNSSQLSFHKEILC